MAYAAEGLSTIETGKRLGIAVRTVEIHRCHAIAKLGARNIAQAAVLFDRAMRPPRRRAKMRGNDHA